MNYVEALCQAAIKLKPKTILEIGLGTDGHSTRGFLERCDAKLTTVDKADWTGLGKRLVKEYKGRFEFIEGRSEKVLPRLRRKFDLIYIDGDHSYEGCKADIINSMRLLADKGVIILDDYGVMGGGVDVVWRGTAPDVVEGAFGVQQAVDEVFDEKWTRALTDIEFANGGVAFKRK